MIEVEGDEETRAVDPVTFEAGVDRLDKAGGDQRVGEVVRFDRPDSPGGNGFPSVRAQNMAVVSWTVAAAAA